MTALSLVRAASRLTLRLAMALDRAEAALCDAANARGCCLCTKGRGPICRKCAARWYGVGAAS